MSFPLIDRGSVRVKECRHGTFAYLTRDQFVGGSLDQFGEFSEGEVAVLRSALGPGGVAVDVGANIGALTVPMADLVGPSGMVVAFEPQRVVFQLLCANLALNGIRNVQALNAAAGSAPGVIEVPALDYEDRGNFGGITLAGGMAAQPAVTLAAPPDRVPVRPLDELALKRLDFLKIDVEGMEADVIAGAESTLKRCRPTLLVENDRDEKSPALIKALLDRKYRLFWHLAPLWRADNWRKNPSNPWPGIVSINMIGVPVERPQSIKGLREITAPDSNWRQG